MLRTKTRVRMGICEESGDSFQFHGDQFLSNLVGGLNPYEQNVPTNPKIPK